MEVVVNVAAALGVASLGAVAAVLLVGVVEVAVALLNRARRANILKRSLKENIKQALS